MKTKIIFLNISIALAIFGSILTFYGFIMNYKDSPWIVWSLYLTEFVVLAISAFSIWKPNKTMIVFSKVCIILLLVNHLFTMGLMVVIPLLVLGPVLWALFSRLNDMGELNKNI